MQSNCLLQFRMVYFKPRSFFSRCNIKTHFPSFAISRQRWNGRDEETLPQYSIRRQCHRQNSSSVTPRISLTSTRNNSSSFQGFLQPFSRYIQAGIQGKNSFSSYQKRHPIEGNNRLKSGSDEESFVGKRLLSGGGKSNNLWPTEVGVLVVGGGAVGCSVAFHLQERVKGDLSVAVVEQDPTYSQASTVLSVGGIREQFSLVENIKLSRYGVWFLRQSSRLLRVEGFDVPDVQFHSRGYLILSSPESVSILKSNYDIQIGAGAKVAFLTVVQLKRRFPWLNTDGVAAGIFGLQNEGWFDPWSFLLGLKRKAASLGTQFLPGKVTGFGSVSKGSNGTSKDVNTAEVTLKGGERRTVKFGTLVVAAGAWSGEVGRLIGLGQGKGSMAIPIPVEPRKRYVYCVHAPQAPVGEDAPILIDFTGTYFRQEGDGHRYLCGRSPSPSQEPPANALDEVDYDYFESDVWPRLAHRVPSFENLKLTSAWSGYYDYNTFDQNCLVGRHQALKNLIIATGFSGHGIQQAAGVGRAVSELILDGDFQTLDLRRFSFQRVIDNEPIFEENII